MARTRVGDWTNLDKAFAELEAELTQVARGLTVKVFNGVLLRTPQFHGRMVASWSYSIGSPNYVDRSSYVATEDVQGPRADGRQDIGLSIKSRGHQAAISIANAENSYADANFKLGDKVYICNGVDHGEGPYSAAIEKGLIELRAANRPGAPVSRTLDIIANNYYSISAKKAQTLKEQRIGR